MELLVSYIICLLYNGYASTNSQVEVFFKENKIVKRKLDILASMKNMCGI